MPLMKTQISADLRPSARVALRPSAFTLLETIVAVVLFAVGTVAVVEVLHRAQVGAVDGENVLTATHLAQRRLEELRNTAYASLANEATASVSSPSGYSRFCRQVTVTTPFANLKQLVVTVYWNALNPPDCSTALMNVSLQTYRSGI